MSYGGKGGRSEEESGGSGSAERATEGKYEQMYENELDPFKEFDSRELAFLFSDTVGMRFKAAQRFVLSNQPPEPLLSSLLLSVYLERSRFVRSRSKPVVLLAVLTRSAYGRFKAARLSYSGACF